ncbi:Nucleotide-binding universal stress protein, UspA family [Halogranum rubrum]|uniref:Nucleotide-binding universal stress protein, UspA family n=1 Tax=Halogranum rubrum TaxID=553466 RepID=A0A1I4HNF3_9EURY|nr:universal stress protein [Halogranum rubrum]SFL43715.1 Nucleotide-binding universal stress protein, UspA family [Halogranum rubrum]
MEDALVVLEDRDACADLLREAAMYAKGADSELVLYSPLTTEQYEETAETLDEIGRVENREYGDDQALGVAFTFARELANDALADMDVEWTIVADVVEERTADHIVDIAEEHDCDHVFTLGNPRSPTGKAVFGDTTQRLILNFPGYVTTRMS